MLHFFDFVFFKVSDWYKANKDKNPEDAGSGIISLFQSFNILSLKMIYDQIVYNTIYLNKLYVLILIVSIMVFNYFRYQYFDNHNYMHEKERWDALSNEKQKTIRLSIIIYLILSVVIFWGFVLFYGIKRM